MRYGLIGIRDTQITGATVITDELFDREPTVPDRAGCGNAADWGVVRVERVNLAKN
jgi:hypothetical protein